MSTVGVATAWQRRQSSQPSVSSATGQVHLWHAEGDAVDASRLAHTDMTRLASAATAPSAPPLGRIFDAPKIVPEHVSKTAEKKP